MKTYDVQSIEINSNYKKVFEFIKDPKNLPKWAIAFKAADEQSAVLETPQGAADIGLEVRSNPDIGSIDWRMTMPDGSIGNAYSRVISNGENKSIYSFILMAPPTPLEEIEGALDCQIKQLQQELLRLKKILDV